MAKAEWILIFKWTPNILNTIALRIWTFFFQKYETQAHQATERTLLIQIGLNWHFRKML